MINFKKEIAKIISEITNINDIELEGYIEVPQNIKNGDYAFPCFRLAKELKKAPPVIANEIKEKIDINNELIETVQVIGGYLNFYINKELLVKTTIEELDKTKEEFGKSNIGQDKKIIVQYSSPNIAKPFHIGHLRNTLIGHSLYNMYKFLGNNLISINH